MHKGKLVLRCASKRYKIKKRGLDRNHRKSTEKTREMAYSRFLSLGGQIVLINSVLSTVPLYQLSLYRMPKWVRRKIDKIKRDFLCEGMRHEVRAYNLITWNKVCNDKKQGGMEISQLDQTN